MDKRAICAALVIASLSTAALAQQSDAIDACAAEKDPTARLACFDHEVSMRQAARQAPKVGDRNTAALAAPTAPAVQAAAVAPAPAAPSAVAPANKPPLAHDPDHDVGLDARELRKQRAARGEVDEPPPATIVATVVTVIPRSPLLSAFELSNGQIWEQTEGMRFVAEPQQQVTIRHGLLGAFSGKMPPVFRFGSTA